MSTRPAHRLSLVRVLISVLALMILAPNVVVAAQVAPRSNSTKGSSWTAPSESALYIVVQSAAPVALRIVAIYRDVVARLAVAAPEPRR